MFNMLKKHYICITLLLAIIGTITYMSLWFKDMIDDRYYPISLSKQDEITINYKTPYIVSDERCFRLEFIIRENNDIKYFYKKYRSAFSEQTEQEFYLDVSNKPKLHIKIFKENNLVHESDMYATDIFARGSTIMNNVKNFFIEVFLSYGYRMGGCYYFHPNSNYQIIVTNLIPKEEYKDTDVFFTISPIKLR
ncbi:hypothetical protein A1D29_03510 [Pasteurellaceae bacterium Orientalotternb1]|nr:hypothetical protein A1D29_03510 [Pasteurellaceae bacterium Orientalotternb1]